MSDMRLANFMNDNAQGVVETAPTLEKIPVKPIGWGWIKRFQSAQLRLIRATEKLKTVISEEDDNLYDQTVSEMDSAMFRVQELLCKVIRTIPASLIVEEGITEIDLSDPEQLDNVDQAAVQALMLDLKNRLSQQEKAEQDAKN